MYLTGDEFTDELEDLNKIHRISLRAPHLVRRQSVHHGQPLVKKWHGLVGYLRTLPHCITEIWIIEKKMVGLLNACL